MSNKLDTSPILCGLRKVGYLIIRRIRFSHGDPDQLSGLTELPADLCDGTRYSWAASDAAPTLADPRSV